MIICCPFGSDSEWQHAFYTLKKTRFNSPAEALLDRDVEFFPHIEASQYSTGVGISLVSDKAGKV